MQCHDKADRVPLNVQVMHAAPNTFIFKEPSDVIDTIQHEIIGQYNLPICYNSQSVFTVLYHPHSCLEDGPRD